jgi:hypothetical protein
MFVRDELFNIDMPRASAQVDIRQSDLCYCHNLENNLVVFSLLSTAFFMCATNVRVCLDTRCLCQNTACNDNDNDFIKDTF